MTEPLDDELARTIGYPEEMDLDEEDIDLSSVVSHQNPLDIDEMIGSLAGKDTTTDKTFERDHKDQGYSYLNVVSTPSDGVAKVKVAPSVQTDSGYGSVTHDNPRPPKNPQANIVSREPIREPLDIVVERSLIEVSLVQGSEDVSSTQSLYTGDQSVMSASRTQRYTLELANYLYSQLPNECTDDRIKSMTEILPELLEAFALKLGQTSQVKVKRDAMYFVHTHKHQITQSLRALFNENRPIHGLGSDFDTEMDKTSILEREEFSTGSQVAESDDECSSEDISRYLDAVTKDPAFRWLIAKLQNILTSTRTDSSAMEEISSCILSHLPPTGELSRLHPSKPFRVTFNVECDILGFIKDQEYHEAAADVIPKVITLTGHLDVQTTTCEQYLLQTWPTVGCNLLYAIQSALREYKASEPLQYSCQCKFEDRTEIKVSIMQTVMKVEAIGTAPSIAELGEQIGWFAAAFRTSFQDSSISFCHPEIIGFRAEDGIERQFEEFEKAFTCIILVGIYEMIDNSPDKNGQCWQYMFNNPVVVTGYPIKPREDIESGIGLELPVDMMMTLADARYLTTFDGKSLVKGFSTVLLPVRQQDNFLIWHLLVNVLDARISYRDSRIQQGILISFDNFASTRHILGWCTDAQNNIGSPGANYDIEYSGLSQGKGSLSWERVELSVGAGNYFKVGTTFARGKKDRMAFKGISDGYVSRVEHIGKQYIMLYDVKEERAWFSDGLPVLLHLVRTSLRRGEKEDPDELIIKHIKKLNEAPPSAQGTMAAKAVLFDEENRLISLRLKDINVTEQVIERTINGETVKELVRIKEKIFFRFENRVEEICHYLEQIIDETAKAINDGVLKHAPRAVLGGFDFVGVATHENLRLLTTKMSIPEHGSGWTDLLDSVAAITLFGKDFGELIKPRAANLAMDTKPCNSCGFNVRLPSGENLLAGSVDVLKKILEKGDKDTTPWRLIDEVYWHYNEAAFGRCRCASSSRPPDRTHFNDRIQILSSKTKTRHNPPVFSSTNIPRNGAVIFGHGRKRGLALMNRNVGRDEKDSSPEDIAQSQTLLGASTSSEAQNDSSETNENQLSDIVSEAESSNTPEIFTSSIKPIPDFNDATVDQQHSSSSGVASTMQDINTVLTQNVEDPHLIPLRKRPIGKMKDHYTRAWKKLEGDKNGQIDS